MSRRYFIQNDVLFVSRGTTETDSLLWINCTEYWPVWRKGTADKKDDTNIIKVHSIITNSFYLIELRHELINQTVIHI